MITMSLEVGFRLAMEDREWKEAISISRLDTISIAENKRGEEEEDITSS